MTLELVFTAVASAALAFLAGYVLACVDGDAEDELPPPERPVDLTGLRR